jgi:hypothetical protein
MDRITTSAFRTEIDFELPLGYVDESGVRHRKGVMRFATAADEILPMRDPRVQANPAYLSIIILARVITRLGSLADIDTQTIERMFTADFEHLRRLYEQINGEDEPETAVPMMPAAMANGAFSRNAGANGHAVGGPPLPGEA